MLYDTHHAPQLLSRRRATLQLAIVRKAIMEILMRSWGATWCDFTPGLMQFHAMFDWIQTCDGNHTEKYSINQPMAGWLLQPAWSGRNDDVRVYYVRYQKSWLFFYYLLCVSILIADTRLSTCGAFTFSRVSNALEVCRAWCRPNTPSTPAIVFTALALDLSWWFFINFSTLTRQCKN